MPLMYTNCNLSEKFATTPLRTLPHLLAPYGVPTMLNMSLGRFLTSPTLVCVSCNALKSKNCLSLDAPAHDDVKGKSRIRACADKGGIHMQVHLIDSSAPGGWITIALLPSFRLYISAVVTQNKQTYALHSASTTSGGVARKP